MRRLPSGRDTARRSLSTSNRFRRRPPDTDNAHAAAPIRPRDQYRRRGDVAVGVGFGYPGAMWRWLAVSAFCVVLSGCSASLLAASRDVELPGYTRVVVDRTSGSTIWLLVYNTTNETLTVDRDAIWLEVDGKRINHFSTRRFFEVPAGGVHDVKLEYHVPGGGGQTARLHLESGIVAQGQSLPVPSLDFTTQ